MATTVKEQIKTTELLLGNNAFVQGCLEAGVSFASAYPGSPSSEIVAELAKVAKKHNMYVEWSTNEKVAVESAAAASYAGLRAVSAMKQLGINVASDFLMQANQCQVVGGMVIIVCDDPGGISSSNEQDSRPYAKWSKLPMLEPADFQESKDITRWAFELSEKFETIVFVRGQTRISHARGNVEIGRIPETKRKPRFDPPTLPISGILKGAPVEHQEMLERAEKLREAFEKSPFNSYTGPDNPELLVITGGVCQLYCKEAVEILGVESDIGILKIGTTWPLPGKLITKYLKTTKKVLFAEHIDPYLEDGIKGIYADIANDIGHITFYGKKSGHISGVGELDPSAIARAISRIMGIEYLPRDKAYDKKVNEIVSKSMVNRPITFCAGCPHRATFWTVKNVLKLVGGDGFTTGDVGCYTMAALPAGFSQLKTIHGMGSGTGLASGFGKLGDLGFDQPVLTVCGDSTFFHTVLPALVNGVYNKSNFTLLVLDNSGTAMTGFQPHPGTGKTAVGDETPVISIENICRSLGIPVEIIDPFNLKDAEAKLTRIIEEGGKGVKVVIMRRKCELIRGREEKPPYSRIYVDTEKCLGDKCGCNRLCTRVFKCPGIIWDPEQGKARIDEALCTKCGVCADICPESAIVREAA